MKIIAFGHRQRTGKDTAAKFMISHLRCRGQKNCDVMGIFEPVKNIASEIFGWAGLRDGVYYDNHSEQKDRPLSTLAKTPRQIWLELGYAIMQISDQVVPELALQNKDLDLLIWTGVRRKIEIEYVRKFNGITINVERNVPKLENLLSGHPAYNLDTELDDYKDWDYTIDNNGNLRELNDKVCKIADEILEIE